MTLDEAINLSKAAAEDMDLQGMPQFAKATRLGIEALKRLKNGGHLSLDELLKPLPGETEGWERRPKRNR